MNKLYRRYSTEFKTLTHLPTYVEMMLSLSVVASFAEYLCSAKINITSIDAEHEEYSSHSPFHSSLSRIELPRILYFLGILLAGAALESLGLLFDFAGGLNALQTASIAAALPFSFVLIMATYGLCKSLYAEGKTLQAETIIAKTGN